MSYIFSVGQRVLLSRNSRYAPCDSNPTQGTRYECEGVIREIDFGGRIKVNWENGIQNSYADIDLIPARPDVEIGDKVKLDTTTYGNTEFNPSDTEGVVIAITDVKLPIEVEWSNGNKNYYNNEELLCI